MQNKLHRRKIKNKKYKAFQNSKYKHLFIDNLKTIKTTIKSSYLIIFIFKLLPNSLELFN